MGTFWGLQVVPITRTGWLWRERDSAWFQLCGSTLLHCHHIFQLTLPWLGHRQKQTITLDTHSKDAGSIPQCWVSVQEQLPQSSNDPGILSEPVSVPAKHLDVFQQEHTGLVLLGLAEGHLYFLLCGCAGVTAQTDAIHLPDTPHNTVATRTAGGQHSTKLSTGNSRLRGDQAQYFPETHSGRTQNSHIQDAMAWINGCFSLLCKR